MIDLERRRISIAIMNSQQPPVNSKLRVRVIPRSPREEFGRVCGSAVVVRLTAPPVDDAANQALVKMLSKALGVPSGDISIVRGSHSRDKMVRIIGLDTVALKDRLQKAGAF